jgi:glycosyltransferase involved in cell wall biosynthesis
VLLWWWSWLWFVGPILKAKGLPICVTGSLEPDIYEKRPWYFRRLVKFGMRFSDRDIFVSHYMIRRLEEHMTLKDPLYCPHIVLDDYRLGNPTNHRKRGDVIFNVAWKKKANMTRKMLPELIDAFALVKKQLPQIRLALAGEPMDGERELRQQASHLGVLDSIDFLGKVSREKKIELMQSCGAYYQCSRHEGFGLAIAEAMACGAPVVVNRKTAIPEVVGDCGYYVRDESPESIAKTLEDVLVNAEHSRSVGLRAAQRIDRQFRFDRRRQFLADVISSLTGSGASEGKPNTLPSFVEHLTSEVAAH